MKKTFFAYLFLGLSFTLSFCQKSTAVSKSPRSLSIKQGICGNIVWKEGNWMPSPDRPASKGKGIPRDVVIYELTKTDQAISEGGFHRNIQTKLIKKVASDSEGNFCIYLPEGQYSIFVWEDGKGLFGNSFDDKNHISPINIQKGKVEQISITVDYKAAY